MAGIFERFATLVTVADLATPLGPDLQSEMAIEDAIYALESACETGSYDPVSRCSLVFEGGKVIGCLKVHDLHAAETRKLSRLAHKIDPLTLISSDMSAIAFATLCCESDVPLFFVLDGNRLIGTVSYSDLYSAPFRLCLFGLTLQLEEAALFVLQQNPDLSINSLSDGRKAKASEVATLRSGKTAASTTRFLVGCTTFIDKFTMLSKTTELVGFEKKQLREIFSSAERVRNYCAHPDGDDRNSAIEKKDLKSFMDATIALIIALGKLKFKGLLDPRFV